MSASDLHESMKDPVIRGQYLSSIRNRGKDVLIADVTEAMDLLIEMAVKVQSAERERDELRDGHTEAAKVISTWHNRAKAAEAEIARRDSVASERVAAHLVYSSVLPKFIGDTDEVESYSCFISGNTPPRKTMEEAYADAHRVCGPLYTAAPPAVLPPNVMNHLSDAANTVSEWTHGDEHSCKVNRTALIAAVQALGAQPQKPVVLPALLTVGQVMHQSGYDRQYAEGWSSGQAATVHDFIQILREANIPYEAKK